MASKSKRVVTGVGAADRAAFDEVYRSRDRAMLALRSSGVPYEYPDGREPVFQSFGHAQDALDQLSHKEAKGLKIVRVKITEYSEE